MTPAQLRLFLVLYLGYTVYYFPRKAVSLSKVLIEPDLGFTRLQLGEWDSAFMIAYTASMLVVPTYVANRVPANKFLFACMAGIALCCVCMAGASTSRTFLAVSLAHGALQATGWPLCVRILSDLLPEKRRGALMGLWATCTSLGGVLGSAFATYVMSGYGWRAGFLLQVPLLLVVGAAMWRSLGAIADQEGKPSAASSGNKGGSDHLAPVSIARALQIPGAWGVAISYFFVKFVRFGLLLWLPYYYKDALNYPVATAGYLSTSFEVGGIVGTPFIGWASDAWFRGRRDVTSCVFMALASVVVFACSTFAEAGLLFNFVCMALIGVLVIGPDSILSGTIAQDLGQRSGMGDQAVSTLAGFFNSIGSMGAILQGVATAWITKEYGWGALFMVFVAFSLFSAAVLAKVSLDATGVGLCELWGDVFGVGANARRSNVAPAVRAAQARRRRTAWLALAGACGVWLWSYMTKVGAAGQGGAVYAALEEQGGSGLRGGR